MEYINIVLYLLFFVICVMGAVYVFSSQKTVSNPFDASLKFPVTGVQYFFLFTLAIGILRLNELSSLRLLVWIGLFMVAILKSHRKISRDITVIMYIFFLFWLLIAIGYSPQKVYGVRVFLKYVYPFLVLILAMKITTSDIFVAKSLKIILKVAIVGLICFLVLSRIPFFSMIISNTLWNYPAFLDFLTVPIAIALTYYSYFTGKKTKYLLYAILFLLCSILFVNRTGLLSASITVIVFALLRYRLKSVPYIVITLAIFIGAILYVPSLRDKMFKKELSADYIVENREALSTKDIDSSGRFAMWEWSLEHFYEDKEWVGSGLGVLQETFYSLKHPFGKIRIVHNDYVQLLCDTGLIGLILYLLTFISLIGHSIVVFYNKRNTMTIRIAALVAASSMAGMAATLYTDNAVNYSLLTLSYPFAVYGMMVGLKSKLKEH